jgi:hypothetical protein
MGEDKKESSIIESQLNSISYEISELFKTLDVFISSINPILAKDTPCPEEIIPEAPSQGCSSPLANQLHDIAKTLQERNKFLMYLLNHRLEL